MEQLSSYAFAIGLIGGVHDLLTKRIPNWLTFPSMIVGIFAQIWLRSGSGFLDGFLGLILGFVLFFPIYLGGYMGAGDVKLQMAVGAWIGWRMAFYVAIGAILIGGAFALFEVIFRGRFFAVFRNGFSFLRSILIPGLDPEKLKVDESRKFAFGICIALAIAGVIYLEHLGRLS